MAVIKGTRYNNTVKGTGANDVLYGYGGHDNMFGYGGADLFYGGPGNDTMRGGAGGDTMQGGDGADWMHGNDGNDRLVGEKGHDQVYGGAGNDTLLGSDGNDSLIGHSGADKLQGGNGADYLDGGAGNDLLIGNAGPDVFVIGKGYDTLNDFDESQGDTIDLTAALANYSPGSEDINDFVQVVYNYTSKSSTIRLAINGDGKFKDVALVKNATYAHLDQMLVSGVLEAPGVVPGESGVPNYQTAMGTVDAFLESLGVCIQIGTTASNLNASLILDSLDYLGISNVRTMPEAPINNSKTGPIYDELANNGVDFNFIVRRGFPEKGDAHLEAYLDFFEDFLQEHPDSIKSIEGLNEVGDPDESVEYKNYVGKEAAAEYQKTLFTSIREREALDDVDVYSFTVWQGKIAENFDGFGDLSAYSDYVTAHTYVTTSIRPYYELGNRIDNVEKIDSDSPAVITETGYASNSQLGNNVSVDQLTQAKLTLNLVMDAYEQGVQATYLYELFDDGTDKADVQDNFGIFTANGTPKKVATAIHNLTSILGRSSGTGDTPDLEFDLLNEDAHTHVMALEKTGGVTNVVIWREEIIWDKKTASRVDADTIVADIVFDETVSKVRVFDPLEGTTLQREYTDTDGFSFEISDHPIVLEVIA